MVRFRVMLNVNFSVSDRVRGRVILRTIFRLRLGDMFRSG